MRRRYVCVRVSEREVDGLCRIYWRRAKRLERTCKTCGIFDVWMADYSHFRPSITSSHGLPWRTMGWVSLKNGPVEMPSDSFSLFQIRDHLQKMLSRKDKSFKDIVKTLQIYHNNVDEDGSARPDGEPSQKEILQHLIAFLDAC